MKAKTTTKTATKTKAKTVAKEKAPAAKKAPAKKPVSTPEKAASAPVKKAVTKKRRVEFTYRAEAGSIVFLAGSFNDWDASAKQMIDKKNNGIYTAVVNLAPGSYEYKYVIDGTWCADPECADWVQNDHGTLNSVRHVSV